MFMGMEDVAASVAGGGGGGAAEPPEGMTGWLKLDDATPGEADAFPTVANAGSVEEDWTRNGSVITLQTEGGPNGMKYADKAVITGDHLKCGTKVVSDFVTAAKGMFGVIFSMEFTGNSSNAFNNSKICAGASTYIGIASNLADVKIVPFYRGSSLNYVLPIDCAHDEWTAMVMRWERGAVNKLFGKVVGDESWSEVAIGQDAFSVADVMQLFGGNGTFVIGSLAEWLAYADQSEEDGDTLLAYLAERGGF